MPRKNWRPVALSLMFVGSTSFVVTADEPSPAVTAPSLQKSSDKLDKQSTVRQHVKPKDLSDSVNKGIKYLVSQQNENGGFGQGGGWRTDSQSPGGRVEGNDVKDPADVGNTCIAALALIRAGNTIKQGPYAEQLAKAVEFIEKHIEESDQESLYVTPVRDTQLQRKIGQYVDTFLAALVLTELKGQMPDTKSEERLFSALNKAIGKIEANQQADGTFAGNEGWASVLSQGICSKAVNRAFQKGVKIKTETIKKDLDQSVAQLDPAKSGAVTGKPVGSSERLSSAPSVTAASRLPSKGDAGVSLYSLSANAGRVQDAVNSSAKRSAEARLVLSSPTADDATKENARLELKQVEDAEVANRAAIRQITENLGDAKFVKGFGNNGGEEFLSYMNISETLFVQGGEEWEKWDRKACEQITNAQNQDGSWSGHHCITGRTFCTSAALLTMMADRAPLPVAVENPSTEVKPAAK